MTPRRLLLTLLSCLSLLVVAPPQAVAAGCADAGVDPGEVARARVIAATTCLVNAERARRGLSSLARDDRLELAARRHARDMVARRYFAHRSPEGRHSSDRIRATGYLASASAWVVGENLAWGTHRRATPRAIVAAWMASPGHRANILDRRYRQLGAGLAAGNPVASGGAGATYAMTFGKTVRARAARR